MPSLFDDLVTLEAFYARRVGLAPAPDLGDPESNRAWAWINAGLNELVRLDFDFAKGVAFDIHMRFCRPPGGQAAIDDVVDIMRRALVTMRQRIRAELN